MKEDDIVEIVSEVLKKTIKEKNMSESKGPPYFGAYPKEKFIKSYTSLPRGRPLLTEYELKQMLKDGKKEIRIAKNAIISPLADDIIKEKGIKVVRE